MAEYGLKVDLPYIDGRRKEKKVQPLLQRAYNEHEQGFYVNVPTSAPRFGCAKCGGTMYPEYYRNELGYEFRLNDEQMK